MTHNRMRILLISAMLLLATPVMAQDAATAVDGAETFDAAPAPADTTAVVGEGAEVLTEADPNVAVDPETGEPIVEDKPKPTFMEQYGFMIMIFGVLAIFMFITSNSRKKQQRKHQDMLSNLKKGDKVVSIGGIVGTIVECREDEIVVKTDETNNTRMKFARWAIRGTGETAKEDPQASK
jgi:preprotein translocase subunit YajC